MNKRNIEQISNELEICVNNIDAGVLIKKNSLPIVHEINPHHVVELNVSLAENIADLNEIAAKLIKNLSDFAEDLDGEVYGGSSVLEDVSDVEPRRYRTTSLSESCAKGFLDITSQQIVLGINDKELGFELFNYLRNINPVFLALSASSPYIVKNGVLESTGALSRRIFQYENLCKYFPSNMWRDVPEINSLEEYFSYLQKISDEVNRRYSSDELDCNHTEVAKFLPFDRLEPHQIYWPIRLRPDHRNIETGGKSVFSLEVRIPDMPTTVQRIQMINSFVTGIAYFIADNGSENLQKPFNESYEDLRIAAKKGLQGKINNSEISKVTDFLTGIAIGGLEERSYFKEANFLGEMVEKVLTDGNDAELILELNPKSVEEFKSYLVTRFSEGEK